MKLKMDLNKLEDKINSEVRLHGEIFAYFVDGDEGRPNYTIFVNTIEHNKLWRKTTSGFSPDSDWDELLRRAYKEDPNLKERLSDERKYGVPDELLDIPHQRGGGHGDLRLRYDKANVIFMPISDYNAFFRNDPGFLGACEILYRSEGFIKGNTDMLSKLGVKIVGE